MAARQLPHVITFDMKSTLAENRLRGFWNMAKGYRLHYIAAIASLAVATTLNTGGFLLIRRFVDHELSLDTPDLLAIFAGTAATFIALTALQGLFTFISGRLAAQTAEGLAMRLRNYLYDHIQRLSFTYHDNMRTGELIQRCTSDVDTIRRFFAEQAIGVGRITMLFVINFITILALQWQLALVSVIVIPIVIVISLWFFRRVSKAWDVFQEQEAVLSTTLQENLTGVRVVKAFARQQYEIDRFETENEKKFRLGKNFTMMHAYYWPTLDLITGAQLLLGYFVGAMMVIDGIITIGTYLAYVSLVIWIIFPMRNLGRLIVQMSTGLVSYDRVVEVIREERVNLEEDATPPVSEIRGDLVFQDVTFNYTDYEPVLRNISFEVKAGQTIALLGSTGSGKTSLLALLPRFYDYSDGSITLDGIELRQYPRYFLRENIGVVEQEPFLFSRSIRENITYSVQREVSDGEVEAAARAAAIHDVIMSFPKGYATMVGERGVTLSGGQKQRIALARTLLKNPKILILDDATSSVDTETESHIRNALNTLMKERTSFIIAHRIQSVMTADLILVMDKGEIIQRGTREELMADESGTYRRIYEMQAQVEEELERELYM